MSASFLVGAHGGAKLLAVGRQRVNREHGRIVYQGGMIPAPAHEIDDAPVCALKTVRGLRGFVGVDYIWNSKARRATVLEINPRPTTSIVALTHLLEPGQLAAAWIAEVQGRGDTQVMRIAERIHVSHQVRFDVEGNVSPSSGGEEG